MTDSTSNVVFVCDLSVFTPDQRPALMELAHEIFQAVQAVHDLPDGYALQLPPDGAWIPKLAEFIAHDRLCCPFMGHGIEAEPNGGPIWLRPAGPAGAKPFIVAEIGGLLAPEVAAAAGFAVNLK